MKFSLEDFMELDVRGLLSINGGGRCGSFSSNCNKINKNGNNSQTFSQAQINAYNEAYEYYFHGLCSAHGIYTEHYCHVEEARASFGKKSKYDYPPILGRSYSSEERPLDTCSAFNIHNYPELIDEYQKNRTRYYNDSVIYGYGYCNTGMKGYGFAKASYSQGTSVAGFCSSSAGTKINAETNVIEINPANAFGPLRICGTAKMNGTRIPLIPA